jgi:hypothetical protein
MWSRYRSGGEDGKSPAQTITLDGQPITVYAEVMLCKLVVGAVPNATSCKHIIGGMIGTPRQNAPSGQVQVRPTSGHALIPNPAQRVAAVREIVFVGREDLQRDCPVVAAPFQRTDGGPDIHVAGTQR